MLLAMKVTDNAQDLEKMKVEMSKLDKEMVEINKKLDGTVKRSEISPIIFDFGKAIEKREYIFMDGEPLKATEFYNDLYAKAEKSIYIIDNYISIKTLRHLCKAKFGIKIMIFSDNLNNYLHLSDYIDFKNEREDLGIEFIKTEGKIHDRFIVLDYDEDNEVIYHAGGSGKDAGKKLTTISIFNDELVKSALHNMVEHLRLNSRLILR